MTETYIGGDCGVFKTIDMILSEALFSIADQNRSNAENPKQNFPKIIRALRISPASVQPAFMQIRLKPRKRLKE